MSPESKERQRESVRDGKKSGKKQRIVKVWIASDLFILSHIASFLFKFSSGVLKSPRPAASSCPKPQLCWRSRVFRCLAWWSLSSTALRAEKLKRNLKNFKKMRNATNATKAYIACSNVQRFFLQVALFCACVCQESVLSVAPLRALLHVWTRQSQGENRNEKNKKQQSSALSQARREESSSKLYSKILTYANRSLFQILAHFARRGVQNLAVNWVWGEKILVWPYGDTRRQLELQNLEPSPQPASYNHLYLLKIRSNTEILGANKK